MLRTMRVTILLDDQLAKQVRRGAAASGISVSAYISRTLSDALKRSEPSEPPPFQLVTVRGVRPRSGIDLDRSRALDAEDDQARFKRRHRRGARHPAGGLDAAHLRTANLTPHTNARTIRSSDMLRLHVRLDAERRRRLEELAEEGGMPMSDVVRGLIDEAYECTMLERRREAVSRLVALEVEDPPDVATLSRELEEAHVSGGLHLHLRCL